jgi:hypothetical protein
VPSGDGEKLYYALSEINDILRIRARRPLRLPWTLNRLISDELESHRHDTTLLLKAASEAYAAREGISPPAMSRSGQSGNAGWMRKRWDCLKVMRGEAVTMPQLCRNERPNTGKPDQVKKTKWRRPRFPVPPPQSAIA